MPSPFQRTPSRNPALGTPTNRSTTRRTGGMQSKRSQVIPPIKEERHPTPLRSPEFQDELEGVLQKRFHNQDDMEIDQVQVPNDESETTEYTEVTFHESRPEKQKLVRRTNEENEVDTPTAPDPDSQIGRAHV